MNQKSLMILNQAQERIEGFIHLGETHNLVLIREAADAFSFLRRIPVDLILLRDDATGMDALEFLMNLRDLRLPTCVIVLYDQALPLEERRLREMTREITNVAFLKEPIRSDDLMRVIRQLERSSGPLGR